MKFLTLLIALPLMAQNPNTPIFPGGTMADSDMLIASDVARTNLVGNYNASATSFTLSDASKFQTPLAIRIENEYIKCTIKSSNVLSTCPRGMYGSTAASHSDGVDVRGVLMAWTINQQSAEIKAVETWAQTARIKTCEIVMGGPSTSQPEPAAALADDDDTPSTCGNDSTV